MLRPLSRLSRFQPGLFAALAVCGLVLVAPTAAAEGPQDPWYADTWRLEDVWEQARGQGITVAVVDTGVDDTRPELDGQVLEGTDLTWDATGPDFDPDGHGTIMASLIAGTGADGGIMGVAPGSKILPIRVGGTDDVDFGDEERWIDAIEYAVDAGARVISVSLGQKGYGINLPAWDAALAEAARHDVLIFAGTGNDASTTNESMVPANLPGVVGVGATDHHADRADFSTYGPHVGLAAPGTGTPGYCPRHQGEPCLYEAGGTSSATALASGAAALVWSAHPDWTKNQVLRALIETADGPAPGERNDEIGYGLIRPDRIILDGQGNPGDPDTNPLFPDWEANLTPPATPEPEPESQPTAPVTPETESAAPATPPASEPTRPAMFAAGDSSNTGPFILLGLTGAVAVGGVFLAVRTQRKKQRIQGGT